MGVTRPARTAPTAGARGRASSSAGCRSDGRSFSVSLKTLAPRRSRAQPLLQCVGVSRSVPRSPRRSHCRWKRRDHAGQAELLVELRCAKVETHRPHALRLNAFQRLAYRLVRLCRWCITRALPCDREPCESGAFFTNTNAMSDRCESRRPGPTVPATESSAHGRCGAVPGRALSHGLMPARWARI